MIETLALAMIFFWAMFFVVWKLGLFPRVRPLPVARPFVVNYTGDGWVIRIEEHIVSHRLTHSEAVEYGRRRGWIYVPF